MCSGAAAKDTKLLNTDMKLELDNIARLMRMAVDYGRKIGFDGDFYRAEAEGTDEAQYDFDTATAIGFLRHGLENDFKINIEANHATLAKTHSSMN